jgi:2-polyprenyl-3-methyl-5-hydroxy-6-metoxy-1,4-benzoquinol methylase
MEYDPIKRSLGNVFNRSPFLRKVFYGMLDLLLLRAWHVHKELKSFAGWSKENLNVLDGGAGFGQYTYWINRKRPSWTIKAIDVKDEQVADCNTFFREIGVPKEKVEFQVGDLTKYRQADSYDLVVCVDVMEHILEDVDVFKNYHASMRPGAMLLISTPSDQGGSGLDEHHEGEVSGFIDEHVRDGYNIQEIQDKLKGAGFSKVDARYQYGGPGKIAWKLSMYYPMRVLNTSKIFFIFLPFYYILTFPISYILNAMDVNGNHDSGTGLIVKAWK